MQQNIHDIIKNQITAHKVVLYMKGSPALPACGFSAKVVQLLHKCGVHDFLCVDVLEDNAIRQGIKEFTNWPTIPQLYINGEFVGGCDIVTQLYDSGELQKLLDQ